MRKKLEINLYRSYSHHIDMYNDNTGRQKDNIHRQILKPEYYFIRTGNPG